MVRDEATARRVDARPFQAEAHSVLPSTIASMVSSLKDLPLCYVVLSSSSPPHSEHSTSSSFFTPAFAPPPPLPALYSMP